MAYDKNDPALVRELQEYLRYVAIAYPRIPQVAVDGIYGPETAEAVRRFQELFALAPTGEVDDLTWETLVAEYRRLFYPNSRPQPIFPFLRGDRTLELGDEGPEVRILQAMLDLISAYYNNLLSVPDTGRFDADTVAAVKVLQRLFSYEQTGVVNRRTWDMLARTFNTYVGR